jgi:hypothetical protein
MVRGGTAGQHRRVHRFVRVALLAVLAMTGCAAVEPAASISPAASSPSASAPTPPADAGPFTPGEGRAWFGMNLDWANDTIASVRQRLGVTPAAWVQFVRFPLTDADRQNLDAFFEQVGAVGGVAVVTLEPHDGLDAVTAAAADELAARLDAAWASRRVRTLVRFAHEMNGSWYAWGQQPEAYVAAFRTVADAVHAGAPASAMVWAPNEGAGYPFSGGAYEAPPGSADRAALDTDGDGELTRLDDPYAPYWPGDDAVDWVGMSLYFWGLEYPWGENEVPPDGRFAGALRGLPSGAHQDEVAVPDFYATYADGHDKPMAIIETAALYDPSGAGPTEAEVKSAWFSQVFSAETVRDFPRIRMINWFEWRKDEPEVGSTIDWRLSGDADLGRALLNGAPAGWLRFADG